MDDARSTSFLDLCDFLSADVHKILIPHKLGGGGGGERFTVTSVVVQVNLDMTDSMGPGKLVRHMQNPSYTYDEYLISIGLGPSISSVICKNPSYSGPSYPILIF